MARVPVTQNVVHVILTCQALKRPRHENVLRPFKCTFAPVH